MNDHISGTKWNGPHFVWKWGSDFNYYLISYIYTYMKFIITESALEKAVYLYLDNLNLILVDNTDVIYLYRSEKDIENDNNNYQIRYITDVGRCAISYELYKEVRDFFSLWGDEAKVLIAKWVENKFGEVTRFYVT